jgi:hypothetical protein
LNCIDFILQLIGQHFKHTTASEVVSKRSKRRKSEGVGQDKDIKQSALMSLLELIISQSTPGYMQYKMLVVFSQLNNKVSKLLAIKVYIYYPLPKIFGGGYRNSLRPSVRPSVLPSDIFVRSISLKVFELST